MIPGRPLWTGVMIHEHACFNLIGCQEIVRDGPEATESNASNRRKRPRSFPPDMCEDSPLLTLILQAFVLSHPKPDLILRDQKMVVLIIRGIIDNVGYT